MQKNKSDIKELAKLFLKLGVIGFGGPAAHIAMMQHEVVHKRRWMSEQHFLDLISITNLIPGPNSGKSSYLDPHPPFRFSFKFSRCEGQSSWIFHKASNE